MAARCSWTKSGIFRWSCSRNYCGSCKSRSSSAWAARTLVAWTFASWLPRIRTLPAWSRRSNFEWISITGSTSFRLRFRHCDMRLTDIPVLVAHFVEKFGARMSKQISMISKEAMRNLTYYSWPGNVRELQNFIERAVILTNGDVLQVPLLPSRTTSNAGPVTLQDAEREHLMKVLEESNWVVGGKHGAAARLGVARTTLMSKMKKRGVSRHMVRSQAAV